MHLIFILFYPCLLAKNLFLGLQNLIAPQTFFRAAAKMLHPQHLEYFWEVIASDYVEIYWQIYWKWWNFPKTCSNTEKLEKFRKALRLVVYFCRISALILLCCFCCGGNWENVQNPSCGCCSDICVIKFSLIPP